MIERTNTEKKRERILHQLKKERTANECIQRLFESDIKNKRIRSWKYYVHLNKLFAPMMKRKMIKQVGETIGPTKKIEKIWRSIESS